MSKVSLDENLFYQYMINNNSTSTMLNAISGNDTSKSSTYNNIAGNLSTMQGLGDTSGLSGLTSLLGGEYNGVGTVSDFSSLLETYMAGNNTSNSEVVEKLQSAMEEAEKSGEANTNSYKTVQELYQYFSENNTGASGLMQALSGTGESRSSGNVNSTSTIQKNNRLAEAEIDFDSLEAESDQMIDELLIQRF